VDTFLSCKQFNISRDQGNVNAIDTCCKTSILVSYGVIELNPVLPQSSKMSTVSGVTYTLINVHVKTDYLAEGKGPHILSYTVLRCN